MLIHILNKLQRFYFSILDIIHNQTKSNVQNFHFKILIFFLQLIMNNNMNKNAKEYNAV
jgi:hypothetical protein